MRLQNSSAPFTAPHEGMALYERDTDTRSFYTPLNIHCVTVNHTIPSQQNYGGQVFSVRYRELV